MTNLNSINTIDHQGKADTEKNRKARRNIWIASAVIAALVVLEEMFFDQVGLDLFAIGIYLVVIFPPIFAGIAAVLFLIYLMAQIMHRQSARKTAKALLICLAIFAVWIAIPFVLVLLGFFPGQQ